MITKQLIAIQGLAKKEITRVLRIWTQTFVSGMVTMILYLVIFGHIIGRHLGLVEGYPYMNFIIPGLIMMQVLTASFANAAGTVFSQRFNRAIEEVLISPMRPISIIIGFCIASLFRATLLTVGLCILSILFTHTMISHIFLLIGSVILCSALMSLLGMLNGLYASQFDHLNIIISFVLTPLIYLGGVFYDIHNLPPVWQKISMFNPITYMVDLFRHALINYPTPHLLLFYVALILLTLGLGAFVTRSIAKGTRIKS